MPEPSPERKPASAWTEAHQSLAREAISLADSTDFERAARGLIAPGSPRRVAGRFGHAVWDLDDYAFLDAPDLTSDPPATVHPSLWRQGRLNNVAGLFEVAPSIYQVRGMDISNVTFIAGQSGWIVIDPLTAEETARAAMAMVNEHFGERPVHAVIYTHSHTDHFGGVHGIVSHDDVASGRVAVIAPAGFLEAAVSENVLAGTVMLRRATYMYGVLLPKDPQGHVDTGLGKGIPALASMALVAPTRSIGETGEQVVIDGVRLVFQLTPGTEAPAEMNVFLPDLRALCMAENCTATQHNVYTLRGAQVRDALLWSKYIDESLERYAPLCTCSSRATTGRGGAPGTSRHSSRASATPTATSTTRRCDWRIADSPWTRSLSSSNCRAASLTRASTGATTARCRTTPRPSTSATSGGSTAIPPTSIPTRPSRRRGATSSSWAERLRCSSGRGTTSTEATIDGSHRS
jgi:alkyl sulfatase BDS1-like metallo-beta-lactamase superfamily hydrolase